MKKVLPGWILWQAERHEDPRKNLIMLWTEPVGPDEFHALQPVCPAVRISQTPYLMEINYWQQIATSFGQNERPSVRRFVLHSNHTAK